MKTKDLRLRVEPDLFEAFSKASKSLDMPVSQVLRRLMAQFVNQSAIEQQHALFPPSMEIGDSSSNTHPTE